MSASDTTMDIVKTVGPAAAAVLAVVALVMPIVRDMVALQTDTVRELSEMNTHIDHLPAEMGQAVADELRAYDAWYNGASYEPLCRDDEPERDL